MDANTAQLIADLTARLDAQQQEIATLKATPPVKAKKARAPRKPRSKNADKVDKHKRRAKKESKNGGGAHYAQVCAVQEVEGKLLPFRQGGCRARVWGLGTGHQCRRGATDGTYCGQHSKKVEKQGAWWQGNYDEIRPLNFSECLEVCGCACPKSTPKHEQRGDIWIMPRAQYLLEHQRLFGGGGRILVEADTQNIVAVLPPQAPAPAPVERMVRVEIQEDVSVDGTASCSGSTIDSVHSDISVASTAQCENGAVLDPLETLPLEIIAQAQTARENRMDAFLMDSVATTQEVSPPVSPPLEAQVSMAFLEKLNAMAISGALASMPAPPKAVPLLELENRATPAPVEVVVEMDSDLEDLDDLY